MDYQNATSIIKLTAVIWSTEQSNKLEIKDNKYEMKLPVIPDNAHEVK